MSRRFTPEKYLFRHKILLFDCIEFNQPFVDVMYDGVYGDGFGVTAASRLGQCLLNTYGANWDWRVAGAVVFEPVCTGEGEFLVVG